MEPWSAGVDVEREHVLYMDSLRRAAELGAAGREALAESHELFAAAMLAAGEPERARGALLALVAARPGCTVTQRFVRQFDEYLGPRAKSTEDRLARLWPNLAD